MNNHDVVKFVNQACIKIVADDKVLAIRHKFRIGDKSTWGVLFFLLGGVFFVIVPFIQTSDYTSKIIGLGLGLLLLVLSILTLIRQVTDELVIKDNILTFRYNLKRTTIPLNGSMKIKMKSEVVRIRRVGTLGSDFIIITHFLQDQKKETPILKFQMENANADHAMKLGNELTRIIDAKIR